MVGGAGNDVLDDSDGGHSRFYDDAGENRIARGPHTRVSDRPYEHPVDRADNPLRDWGGSTGVVPWGTAGGGLGVVLGLELRHTSYGFRKHPYASRHSLQVGYSTSLGDFGGEYAYEALRTDNRGRLGIEAKISKLELIHYHGFGNETEIIANAEDFYEVKQRQYSFAPSYRLELDPIDIHVGPIVKFATTDLDDRPTLLGLEQPYGTEDFGQVGARVRVALDRRDLEKAATRGGVVLRGGVRLPQGLERARDVRRGARRGGDLPDGADPVAADARAARGGPEGLRRVPLPRVRVPGGNGHGPRPAHPALSRATRPPTGTRSCA